jgi:23S rRNA pseudouridine1911/1915/1917 synthase
MIPKILFEDEELLAISKPAGMTVNRAETTRGEETVQDWLKNNFNFPLASLSNLRNGIVHRLDKETSGILLIAKTSRAFEDLQRQFKERKIKKKYLALAHGKVEPLQGIIQASISRSPFDRKKFGVFLGGREAKTNYEVKKYYHLNDGNYSFLDLAPTTGRTHQIRVHLKFIGHPIVTDKKYVGRKTLRKDLAWCPRLFLHATFLSFTQPKNHQKITLNSELPSDLRLAMMKLKSDDK